MQQQMDFWEWTKRAATLAAIAALIVVLIGNGFDSVATRIADTEDRLTTQMHSLETKLDTYIIRVDERVAHIEQEQARLDGVVTGYIEAREVE